MSDMMTFPDTWEEFEKSYGFTDNEEVYTNGARLIPSFRVKQWLDHLPSVQPELANNSPKLDIKNGELISRQAAMKIRFSSGFDHDGILFVPYRDVEEHLKKLPSAQPEIIRCKNCRYSIDEYGDGECYCKRPSRELVWIGKRWDFFCAAARLKMEVEHE